MCEVRLETKQEKREKESRKSFGDLCSKRKYLHIALLFVIFKNCSRLFCACQAFVLVHNFSLILSYNVKKFDLSSNLFRRKI